MKYIYFLIALFLVGCGRTTVCTKKLESTIVMQFGPLEKFQCMGDEVILSTIPRYAPGGQITHVDVQCGKVVMSCT